MSSCSWTNFKPENAKMSTQAQAVYGDCRKASKNQREVSTVILTHGGDEKTNLKTSSSSASVVSSCGGTSEYAKACISFTHNLQQSLMFFNNEISAALQSSIGGINDICLKVRGCLQDMEHNDLVYNGERGRSTPNFLAVGDFQPINEDDTQFLSMQVSLSDETLSHVKSKEKNAQGHRAEPDNVEESLEMMQVEFNQCLEAIKLNIQSASTALLDDNNTVLLKSLKSKKSVACQDPDPNVYIPKSRAVQDLHEKLVKQLEAGDSLIEFEKHMSRDPDACPILAAAQISDEEEDKTEKSTSKTTSSVKVTSSLLKAKPKQEKAKIEKKKVAAPPTKYVDSLYFKQNKEKCAKYKKKLETVVEVVKSKCDNLKQTSSRQKTIASNHVEHPRKVVVENVRPASCRVTPRKSFTEHVEHLMRVASKGLTKQNTPALSCIDILDDLTQKDVAPILSEYPRKDYCTGKQNISKSFLYKFVHGTKVNRHVLELLTSREIPKNLEIRKKNMKINSRQLKRNNIAHTEGPVKKRKESDWVEERRKVLVGEHVAETLKPYLKDPNPHFHTAITVMPVLVSQNRPVSAVPQRCKSAPRAVKPVPDHNVHYLYTSGDSGLESPKKKVSKSKTTTKLTTEKRPLKKTAAQQIISFFGTQEPKKTKNIPKRIEMFEIPVDITKSKIMDNMKAITNIISATEARMVDLLSVPTKEEKSDVCKSLEEDIQNMLQKLKPQDPEISEESTPRDFGDMIGRLDEYPVMKIEEDIKDELGVKSIESASTVSSAEEKCVVTVACSPIKKTRCPKKDEEKTEQVVDEVYEEKCSIPVGNEEKESSLTENEEVANLSDIQDCEDSAKEASSSSSSKYGKQVEEMVKRMEETAVEFEQQAKCDRKIEESQAKVSEMEKDDSYRDIIEFLDSLSKVNEELTVATSAVCEEKVGVAEEMYESIEYYIVEVLHPIEIEEVEMTPTIIAKEKTTPKIIVEEKMTPNLIVEEKMTPKIIEVAKKTPRVIEKVKMTQTIAKEIEKKPDPIEILKKLNEDHMKLQKCLMERSKEVGRDPVSERHVHMLNTLYSVVFSLAYLALSFNFQCPYSPEN